MSRTYQTLLILWLAFLTTLLAQRTEASSMAGSPNRVQGEQVVRGVLQLQKGEELLPLADRRMILDIYRGDKVIAASEARTNKQGRYEFNELKSAAELSYQLKTTFEGAPFYSTRFRLQKEQRTRQLDLKVYPHAADVSLLHMELVNVGVFAEEGQHLIQIEETMIISNENSTAFYSDLGLHIPLPKRALNPEIKETEAFRIVEDHLHISSLIPPKSSLQLHVKYQLGRSFAAVHFLQELPMKVKKWGVMLYPSSMRVKALLKDYGERFIGGNHYAVYISEKANTPVNELRFTLRHIPGGLGWPQLTLIAFLPIILVAAFLLVRRPSIKREYELTLEKLRRLEEVHEKGVVDEEAYQEAKSYLMQQLMPLKKRLTNVQDG